MLAIMHLHSQIYFLQMCLQVTVPSAAREQLTTAMQAAGELLLLLYKKVCAYSALVICWCSSHQSNHTFKECPLSCVRTGIPLPDSEAHWAQAMQAVRALITDLHTLTCAHVTCAGIPLPDSEARWAQAMQAIKGVWASKYNDRAYFSLKKVGAFVCVCYVCF